MSVSENTMDWVRNTWPSAAGAAARPVPVPAVPSRRRRPITKTQQAVLQRLVDHGPSIITHGTRWLNIFGDTITMKSDAVFFLMTSGMVAAAKGNYDPDYFRITPYGVKCLERGYRDGGFSISWNDAMGHKFSAHKAAREAK